MTSNWVRGKIVKYVTYKARWEGIKVKLVSAKNTSKTCHLCGSQGLRTNATFFCEHCKHTYNADFNASVNIGIRATLPTARRKPHFRAKPYKAPCVMGTVYQIMFGEGIYVSKLPLLSGGKI